MTARGRQVADGIEGQQSGSGSGGGVDGTCGSPDLAQAVVDEITAAGGVAVANQDSVTDRAGAQRMADMGRRAVRWGLIRSTISTGMGVPPGLISRW